MSMGTLGHQRIDQRVIRIDHQRHLAQTRRRIAHQRRGLRTATVRGDFAKKTKPA
jgi:hypothetical protein